jgi:hypothetical protein
LKVVDNLGKLNTNNMEINQSENEWRMSPIRGNFLSNSKIKYYLIKKFEQERIIIS